MTSNLRYLSKIEKLLREDFKKEDVKKVDDSILYKWVKNYKEAKTDKERVYWQDKIILQLLPIIISKVKNYFPQHYLIETPDLINEIVLLVIKELLPKFDIKRVKNKRLSLLFALLNLYIKQAYNNLKKKQFSTNKIHFKEFKKSTETQPFKDYIDFYQTKFSKTQKTQLKAIREITGTEAYAIIKVNQSINDSNFNLEYFLNELYDTYISQAENPEVLQIRKEEIFLKLSIVQSLLPIDKQLYIFYNLLLPIVSSNEKFLCFSLKSVLEKTNLHYSKQFFNNLPSLIENLLDLMIYHKRKKLKIKKIKK